MTKARFCDPRVKEYEKTASERSDSELMAHLFEHYPTLTSSQQMHPHYRKWRRCVIVELLKRGLIAKDPGMGKPEGS